MVKHKASLAFLGDEFIGVLVEREELAKLGGQSLVDAFDGHHVQLARQRTGAYAIIDDVNSYRFIDDVVIEETWSPHNRVGARWKLCAEQTEKVRTELGMAA
jgi:hypothetical protein